MNYIKTSIAFLLSIGLLCISYSNASTQSLISSQRSNKIDLAVTKFQPYGDLAERNEWVSDALQHLIYEDLEPFKQISVLPPTLYDGMLTSENLDGLNPNTEKNSSLIARVLRVDVLLIGTYRINGTRIKLQALLHRPENNETVSTASTTGMHSSLSKLQDRLLSDLLKSSPFRISQTDLDRINQNRNISTVELQKRFDSETSDRGAEGIKTNRGEKHKQEESADKIKMPSESKSTTFSKNKAATGSGMYVGFHYPGITFGISPTPKSSFQIRASSNSDVQVLDIRGNKHFWISDETNLFFGGSLGLTQFQGEVTEGDGFLLGAHIGTQKFLNEIISFSLDIGPVLVHLQDDDTELTQAGLNFMLNGGVEYHF